MVESDLNNSQIELSGRLQKLMFLRVLFISLLLGVSVFIQVRETKTYFGDIQTFHYLLIITLYFLTFIYVILLKVIRNISQLAYVQLLTDRHLKNLQPRPINPAPLVGKLIPVDLPNSTIVCSF